MRIAIFPNYGASHQTLYKDDVNKNWVENRIALAEYIDSLNPTHDEINQKIYDEFKQNKDLYIKAKNEDSVIYIKTKDRFISVTSIKIIDVDVSKKWTISEHDGAEYIDYLEDIKLIYPDLNYYEK